MDIIVPCERDPHRISWLSPRLIFVSLVQLNPKTRRVVIRSHRIERRNFVTSSLFFFLLFPIFFPSPFPFSFFFSFFNIVIIVIYFLGKDSLKRMYRDKTFLYVLSIPRGFIFYYFFFLPLILSIFYFIYFYRVSPWISHFFFLFAQTARCPNIAIFRLIGIVVISKTTFKRLCVWIDSTASLRESRTAFRITNTSLSRRKLWLRFDPVSRRIRGTGWIGTKVREIRGETSSGEIVAAIIYIYLWRDLATVRSV